MNQTDVPILFPPRPSGVIFGVLLGIAGVIGLYFLPAETRGRMPQPLQDLFLEPALIGQGVFVATFWFLLGEWRSFRCLHHEVAALQKGEEREASLNKSWAAITWQASFKVKQARLSMRKQSIAKCERYLENCLESRWRFYFLLSVLPAFLGWLVGERALRFNPNTSEVYTEYFTPLLVGTAESLVLLLLAIWMRRYGSLLFQAWGAKVAKLEGLSLSPPTKQLMPDGVKPVEHAKVEVDSGYNLTPTNTNHRDDNPPSPGPRFDGG